MMRSTGRLLTVIAVAFMVGCGGSSDRGGRDAPVTDNGFDYARAIDAWNGSNAPSLLRGLLTTSRQPADRCGLHPHDDTGLVALTVMAVDGAWLQAGIDPNLGPVEGATSFGEDLTSALRAAGAGTPAEFFETTVPCVAALDGTVSLR